MRQWLGYASIANSCSTIARSSSTVVESSSGTTFPKMGPTTGEREWGSGWVDGGAPSAASFALECVGAAGVVSRECNIVRRLRLGVVFAGG